MLYDKELTRQEDLGVKLYLSHGSLKAYIKIENIVERDPLESFLRELGIQSELDLDIFLDRAAIRNAIKTQKVIMIADEGDPDEVLFDLEFIAHSEEIKEYTTKLYVDASNPREPFISVPEETIIANRLDQAKIDKWQIIRDVFGKVHEKKRTLISLKAGKGVFEDSTGRLMAVVPGRLEFKASTIQISDTFRINSMADWSEGNLFFHGSVEVGHDLMENFDIKAGKDIVLRGCSDSANLKAGGNIEVNEGIIGHEVATVEAWGNVKARYINQATVTCGCNCEVSRGIFHSNVYAYDHILNPSGVIVGGVTYGAAGIEAKELGAVSEPKTVVAVGQFSHAPYSPESVTKELEVIKEKIIKIHAKVRPYLEAGKLEPKAQEAVKKFIGQLEDLKLRHKELSIWLDAHNTEEHQGAQIIVKSTVYPNVVVVIDNRLLEIKHSIRGAIFRLDKNKDEVVVEALY